jgi:membrane protein YqaA with SNARE-associated domain
MIINFIIKFGYFGLFLLGLSIAIYQPVAPDFFIIGFSGIGLNAYWAATIAFIGTVIGAILGYGVGRWLEKVILIKLIRKWQNRFDRGKVLFRKYGVWAVLIAAVSPLPLSQISWLAGMSRMSLVKFSLTICAGLIPRYFGEAIFANQLKDWLIK